MKYFLVLGGLLFFTLPSYADTGDTTSTTDMASTANTDDCATNNPYSSQTCQTLRQSSQNAQKTQEEAYQDQVNKKKEAIKKQIAKERMPPPPTPKQIPGWQKSLEPATPVQNEKEITTSKPPENSPDTEEQTAAIPLLPAPGATEFANPTPITLPGGVTMIPTKPDKKSGANKYP